METEITIKPTFEINGTSYKGHINISYDKLVSVFGKEHIEGDKFDKILCEWAFEFPDKTVATIYNYKTGKNYDPIYGKDKEDIDLWHVGGFDSLAFHYINLLLMGKTKWSGLGYPNSNIVFKDINSKL